MVVVKLGCLAGWVECCLASQAWSFGQNQFTIAGDAHSVFLAPVVYDDFMATNEQGAAVDFWPGE